MLQNNKTTLFIIFLGFILSILISINNLNKYDKNVTDINGRVYHQMIKYDTFRYLTHGDEIKNQLKNGLNFFKTGREHYTKYLPPRLMAAYYYFFEKDLYSSIDKKEINEGIHLPYIIIQCFFYFLCITFLFRSINKIFDKRLCFFIIAFLSLEPTILQYHGTFWSESIFFSLQILLIALILKPKHKIGTFFSIGIFLAILSLQKEYAIFYIFPITFFLIIFSKKKEIKNFIVLIFGFIIVQLILGFNNYSRSGDFYIMPATTKTDLHMLIVSNVVSDKLTLKGGEFETLEGKAVSDWINKNSITLKHKIDNKLLASYDSPTLWVYRNYIKNEADKTKFDQFIQKRTFNYFKEYPIGFVKEIIKKSAHIVLLNPFHIYSDHKFISGEVYYLSEKHDKLIPYRIVYSLFIYFICLFGLYHFFKLKDYRTICFLLLSIFYFYLPVSWHGNTRYFLPCYIYLSFFFAMGMDGLIKYKKNLFK